MPDGSHIVVGPFASEQDFYKFSPLAMQVPQVNYNGGINMDMDTLKATEKDEAEKVKLLEQNPTIEFSKGDANSNWYHQNRQQTEYAGAQKTIETNLEHENDASSNNNNEVKSEKDKSLELMEILNLEKALRENNRLGQRKDNWNRDKKENVIRNQMRDNPEFRNTNNDKNIRDGSRWFMMKRKK